MNTTSCPECLHALQRVVHKVFEPDCEGCVIRRLAYMPVDERERWLDKVQHLGGMDDRREAKRLIDQERARIAALAVLMPKPERA